MVKMAVFKKGEEVEVCSKEEGFLGSYYEATVVSKLDDRFYKVEYKNLVEEEDHSRRLVEIVPVDELRSLPPKSAEKARSCYSYLHKVDAFDNDGWWVGKITGRKGSEYWVYFDTTGDAIAYPVSRLRSHLDWRLGLWVSPKENSF